MRSRLALAVALAAAVPAFATDPLPTVAATPSISEQRDVYQQRLAEALQQHQELARQIEQLKGAIAALSAYAPPSATGQAVSP